MADTRILVVDDEAAERITLGEVLRLEGYHVTLAASGEEALAIAQKEDPFELAILDLRLPGIDGMRLAELNPNMTTGDPCCYLPIRAGGVGAGRSP